MSIKIWTLENLRVDDPRHFLEVIVFKVICDEIQAIKYNDDKVYVISEKQYQKLLSLDKDNS